MTTTKFFDLTSMVAANFGLPDCRIVVVEHPLGGTDEDAIVGWAEAAVEPTIVQYTGGGR
jgi:hypothetical protein